MADDFSGDEAARIRDLLSRHPLGLNIKGIAAALGMSRNSVAKYLDVLTASGYLEVRHVGNAKMFYLVERLPVGQILSLSQEMTAFLDRDLRIVRASEPFARVNGCRPGDILRTRLPDLPILSGTADPGPGLAGLSGGEPFCREIRTVQDGQEVVLEMRITPATFEDGEAGFVLRVDDISARTRAEEAARESERLLHTIFQISPVAYFIINRNHRVVTWNRVMELLTKIRAEEVTGSDRHWQALYREKQECLADILVDNDTGALAKLAGLGLRTGYEPGTYEYEDEFELPGRGRQRLRISARILRDMSGNLLGALQTVEEVRERKAGESESTGAWPAPGRTVPDRSPAGERLPGGREEPGRRRPRGGT